MPSLTAGEKLSLFIQSVIEATGKISFWFEETKWSEGGPKLNQGGYHPFAWRDTGRRSRLRSAIEGALGTDGIYFSEGKLRLPQVAAGIPKPSPANWIELPYDQVKKSGLSTFTLSVIGTRRYLSATEVLNIIDNLRDLEVVDDRSEDSMGFIDTPAIQTLEIIAQFVISLIKRQQFVPSLEPTGYAAKMGYCRWSSVLGRNDVRFVRRILEEAPGELFAKVLPTRDQSDALPPKLLRRAIDTMLDQEVRRAIHDVVIDTTRPTVIVKPLDDFVAGLSGNLLSPRSDLFQISGRIPELLVEWQEKLKAELAPLRLALRVSPPGYFEIADHQTPFIGAQDDGKASDPLVDPMSNNEVTDGSPMLIRDQDDERWEIAFGLCSSGSLGVFLDLSDSIGIDEALAEMAITADEAELIYLRALSKVAPYDPLVEEASKLGKYARIYLNSDQLITFVREVASPLAEDEGVVLLLPRSLRESVKPRVQISSAPVKSNNPKLGLDALYSYSATVTIGERQLSSKEIEELLASKSPIVKVDDDWFFVDHRSISRALSYLKRHEQRSNRTLAALLAESIGDIDDEELVSIDRPDPQSLIDQMAKVRLQDKRPFVEPNGFSLSLRDYQRRGVDWMASLEAIGLGACLADDMGLGKTAQVIALLAQEHQERLTQQQSIDHAEIEVSENANLAIVQSPATLIVAPVSVVGNWRREFARFYPLLSVMVHHGSNRADGREFAEAVQKHDVVITSYSLLARDIGSLSSIRWHRIVVDEAQNIKNPTAAMTIAANSLTSYRRIALTGTPVENHTGELWAIMNFINPGLLGSRGSFRTRFSIPIEREGNQIVAAHLSRSVAPFLLRRLKTDKSIISDLPDKIEVKEYCGLSRDQEILYKDAVNSLKESLEGASKMARRGAILASITKLKQICNHPTINQDATVLRGSSAKMGRLEELLEEILEGGEKVIIFTQFATFGSLLHQHLQERFRQRVLYLHGGSTMPQRDSMVGEFASSEGPSIFLLSLKAGGTGLNLTAANHVIHYDRWWNSAVETQATDRAFRIGQRKDVVVRKLICEGTLEERIDSIIESKKQLAESLISTGETWITELDDGDLMDLLSLSSVEERYVSES